MEISRYLTNSPQVFHYVSWPHPIPIAIGTLSRGRGGETGRRGETEREKKEKTGTKGLRGEGTKRPGAGLKVRKGKG